MDQASAASETKFQSMNPCHSCNLLGHTDHKASKNWGQSIFRLGDLAGEQSSRGHQANPESDHLQETFQSHPLGESLSTISYTQNSNAPSSPKLLPHSKHSSDPVKGDMPKTPWNLFGILLFYWFYAEGAQIGWWWPAVCSLGPSFLITGIRPNPILPFGNAGDTYCWKRKARASV